jgi:hypothetical protein
MSVLNCGNVLLRTAALIITISCGLWASVATAQLNKYTFDLPEQPLSGALHAYARVTGQEIIRLCAGRLQPTKPCSSC